MLFSILNFIHFVYSLVTYWIRVVYILVFCSCFVSQSGKSTPLLGLLCIWQCTVCPKKVTYSIMLESQCTTGSNTSSRHPLGLENVFLVVSTWTYQDQALPSHVDGKMWPHSTQFFTFVVPFWDIL